MRSKAVVFPAVRRAELREVPVPEPGPRDLVVDVEYSCISNGTERWCITGRLEVPGGPPLEFPHVPGYQAAGVVREVGREIRGFAPGDRVFSRNCREPAGHDGSWWGGHVQRHVTGPEDVLKLPDAVSTLQASGLLLAQVGYNGASRPRVSQGDVAVIIGEGLVGQFAGQVLRHRGAHVIVAGLDPRRLELAARFSADEVYDNSGGDLAHFIESRFPGGVPIVLETASSADTVRMAALMLCRNGHLVLNGYYPPGESLIDWHWLRRKEITLYCPDSRTPERLKATLGLMEGGQLRVVELITHRLHAERAPVAYGMLLDPGARFLGMVLEWEGRYVQG